MNLHKFEFQVMGCPCEIRLFAWEADHAGHVAELCADEASRFERKYSRYLEDSVTTKINRAAGRSPFTIDPETAAVLAYSNVCYEQSNGFFDITSGVLRQIWHKERTTLPTEREMDACLQKVGWDKVQLTTDSIFLSEIGMEIDFGGVVKEYAADALANVAKSSGIEHGLINLGGDIRAIGPQLNNEPWAIGITHPTEANQAIAVIELKEGALTTSGGYERYFEIDGERFSHLLNPKNGWPVDSLLSATVVAPQAIVAGSLTSIALLQAEQDGLAFLEDCGLPYLAVDKALNCHGHLAEIPDD